MALLGHVPRGGFAEATEDSRVCVVNRASMHRIISLHPEVAERILLATYAHLEELKQRLEHASFSSVKVRLAHFLRVKLACSALMESSRSDTTASPPKLNVLVPFAVTFNIRKCLPTVGCRYPKLDVTSTRSAKL